MRVVNASPLIVLSKLGRLDLLLEPRPDIEVVVPQAVLDEVMRGEPDDPAVSLVPEAVADWMRVMTASFQDGRRSASFFSDEAPSPRRTSSTASSPWLRGSPNFSSLQPIGQAGGSREPAATASAGWV